MLEGAFCFCETNHSLKASVLISVFKKSETHQHTSAHLLQTGIHLHTHIGMFLAGYCKLHCCHIELVALNIHQHLEYYKDSHYYKYTFNTDTKKKQTVQLLNNSRLEYLIHILDRPHLLEGTGNLKIIFR